MSGWSAGVKRGADVPLSRAVTKGGAGCRDSRAETSPSPGAVTGETGVASVDTLRDTATLTRLRDATRRRDVAAHEVDTEMTRAFAEGFSPAEIDAAMAVRWPGVPS